MEVESKMNRVYIFVFQYRVYGEVLGFRQEGYTSPAIASRSAMVERLRRGVA